MAYDELVALEHENWIAYVTGVVTCTSRAVASRANGVVSVMTGLPMDWFNQVLIEGEEATPTGVLAGVARAREGGHHFVVRLREGIDDRFIPTLIQAGLAPAGEETSTPGMVAFPIDHEAITAHASPELEIRAVTDAAGIDAHRRVVTGGLAQIPRSPWERRAATSSTGPNVSSTSATWTVPQSSPGWACVRDGPSGSTASRRSRGRGGAGTARP